MGVSDIQDQASAIAALERKNKEFLRERLILWISATIYLLILIGNFSDRIDFKKKEKALENFVI